MWSVHSIWIVQWCSAELCLSEKLNVAEHQLLSILILSRSHVEQALPTISSPTIRFLRFESSDTDPVF